MGEKLYRSRTQRVIGGVCGGFAEYFDIDVTLIRLIWIILAFLGGGAIIAYIIAMIIIPLKPAEAGFENQAGQSAENNGEREIIVDGEIIEDKSRIGVKSVENKRKIFGLILIVLGVYFSMDLFWGFNIFRYLWPLVLILSGIYILFRMRKGE